jgi:hypothetical protein
LSLGAAGNRYSTIPFWSFDLTAYRCYSTPVKNDRSTVHSSGLKNNTQFKPVLHTKINRYFALYLFLRFENAKNHSTVTGRTNVDTTIASGTVHIIIYVAIAENGFNNYLLQSVFADLGRLVVLEICALTWLRRTR